MRPRIGDFARICGEPLGAPATRWHAGDWPTPCVDREGMPREHARFGWTDAVAWRLSRDLAALGLRWDRAAALIRECRAAAWAIRRPNDARGDYLAIWARAAEGADLDAPLVSGLTCWLGSMPQIARVLAADGEKPGELASLRIVSLSHAIVSARLLAHRAGFEPVGDEFEPLAAEVAA